MRKVTALMLLTLAAATSAGEAAPLDDLLASTEPCRDLPQINETESVTLERATITVLPKTAEMAVTGGIACRSGEGALFQGDASVRIEAEVTLRLSDCTATRSEVRLSEFDGSVGSLVEAFASALEADLSGDVAEAAERACKDLLEDD